MHHRPIMPLVSAALAITFLGACADDDPSTTATDLSSTTTDASTTETATDDDALYLARGTVDFDGTSGLFDQTLDITAEERGSGVTGEARFTPSGLTINLQCSDTARGGPGGMVVLGGEVTATTRDQNPPVGAFMAVVILEAERDSVALWFDETNPGDCQHVIDSVPAGIAKDPDTTLLVTGDDIETGWDCEALCSRP